MSLTLNLQQLNSSLTTVYEVDPSPESSPTQFYSPATSLSWTPTRSSVNSKPPSHNERRSHQSFVLSPVSKTPVDLLKNDWLLQQELAVVAKLFEPGSLTGSSKPTAVKGSYFSDCLPAPLSPRTQAAYNFSSPPQTPKHPPRARIVEISPREMPPKRKAKAPAGEGSPPKMKRSNGRKDLLHDEKHVFSAKSKLIGVDLALLLSNPLAWSKLTDEEKEKIRSLMPGDMIYNDDGSLPSKFLRFDGDWRSALSFFNEDLASGRYEPEWLSEAHEAAEMRRRGNFDKWKEDQFEEFWGQKSESYAELLSEEASKIRLGEMIQGGVFQVGDVFVYQRSFGAGKNGFLVDKECEIVKIHGKTMELTVASGQHKRPPKGQPASEQLAQGHPPRTSSRKASSLSPEQASATPEAQRVRTPTPTRQTPTKDEITSPEQAAALPDQSQRSVSVHTSTPPPERTSTPTSQRSASAEYEGSVNGKRPKKKTSMGSIIGSIRRKSPADGESTGSLLGLRRKPAASTPKLEIISDSPTKHEDAADASDSPLSSLEDGDLESVRLEIQSTPRNKPPETKAFEVTDDVPTPNTAASEIKMIMVKGVDALGPLEKKLVQLDGRYKGEPRATYWKIFRCKRGDEDLGTLWDMREKYYKLKNPV